LITILQGMLIWDRTIGWAEIVVQCKKKEKYHYYFLMAKKTCVKQ